jgi:sigma54-dependent transcription regulator
MPYTFATTTIQPTTTQWRPTIFVTQQSSFVTEAPVLIEKSRRLDKLQTIINDVTDQPRHLSTIVDSMEVNDLEPADLSSQIEFDRGRVC